MKLYTKCQKDSMFSFCLKYFDVKPVKAQMSMQLQYNTQLCMMTTGSKHGLHNVHKYNNHYNYLTWKICAMICLHDSSEIIARTCLVTFFLWLCVADFFNAFYICHIYSIELIHVWYWLQIIIIRNKVD